MKLFCKIYSLRKKVANKSFTLITLLTLRAISAWALPDGSLSDTNIQYFGRWDFSNPTQYQAYWVGAYIKVNFSGTAVKIRLGNTNNYYVKIDGGNWTSYTNVTGTLNLTPTPLANGIHTLSVAAGQDYSYVFNFQGISLNQGATTSPPTVAPTLIEFIGDSITCGFLDPQEDVSAYAWICSGGLNCEHTQMAYPGITLVTGYGYNADKTGMDIQYFKLQPLGYASPASWAFNTYTPKVVVINLGQNDNHFSVPDATFQSDYTYFLASVRAKFLNAEIFAMRPFSGAKAAQTLAAVNARVVTGDSHVHYIDTTTWLSSGDYLDGTHPSASGQTKAANLLKPILAAYVSASLPPTIGGLTVNTNGSATVLYASLSGFNYHVETTTNLSQPSWAIVPGSVTNITGNSVTFTDRASVISTKRFYRVVSP